mgnify:CR=1 FL=1
MRIASKKLALVLAMGSFGDLLMAQSAGGEGPNWFVYILLAVAVLLFFVIVIQVSDNMLAIEAKRSGATDDGTSLSIFPSTKELVPRQKPDYAMDERVIRSSRGHDILLEGEAKKTVVDGDQVKTFGIMPPNFIGISPIPKVVVEAGQHVKAGDTLFFDKKRPEIKYAAPVSGEVIEINRGAKRSIAEVVILADKEQQYRELPTIDPDKAERGELIEFLLESGVWPMIRQRPYNVVPDHNVVPRDIFITTFDTAPLAPDLSLVVEGRGEAFQKGLDVLNKLTDGKVYLGLDARDKENAPSEVFLHAEGVEKRFFSGKHPIGNVGVQMHNTRPLTEGDVVWTPDVQAVISIGALFTEQRFNAERVIAVTGAEIKEPHYVRTYQGARIKELLHGQLEKKEDEVRFICGDVLSGAKASADSFVHYYDDQLTVVEEGDYHELFGWLLPIAPRPSISGTFPNFLFPGLRFKADTNTHGERRAFVKTGDYERVLPMDIYPQQLMKSILVSDIERMEGLGIKELVEEDIALCEFVCVSKQPLQQILRQGLDVMREEG